MNILNIVKKTQFIVLTSVALCQIGLCSQDAEIQRLKQEITDLQARYDKQVVLLDQQNDAMTQSTINFQKLQNANRALKKEVKDLRRPLEKLTGKSSETAVDELSNEFQKKLDEQKQKNQDLEVLTKTVASCAEDPNINENSSAQDIGNAIVAKVGDLKNQIQKLENDNQTTQDELTKSQNSFKTLSTSAGESNKTLVDVAKLADPTVTEDSENLQETAKNGVQQIQEANQALNSVATEVGYKAEDSLNDKATAVANHIKAAQTSGAKAIKDRDEALARFNTLQKRFTDAQKILQNFDLGVSYTDIFDEGTNEDEDVRKLIAINELILKARKKEKTLDDVLNTLHPLTA